MSAGLAAALLVAGVTASAPVRAASDPLAVQIESRDDHPVALFRFARPGDRDPVGNYRGVPYVRACPEPCAVLEVDPDDEFFVAHADVMPSASFSLAPYVGPVRLVVRPGPRRIRFAGFGLTVSGAVLVPAGGLLAAGVADRRGATIAGFALLGVGAAAVAVGIGLLLRGRTRVEIFGQPRRGPTRQGRTDAATRRPWAVHGGRVWF